MKKIISVIGTRPEFIQISALNPVFKKTFNHLIVHTGQHYDLNMSEGFLKELNIKADYNLNIGSSSHAGQTASMLIALEKVFLKEKPDLILVYGDTNTTLAGGLAAKKAGFILGHVEAGMRSFDKKMPEEINRLIVDHIADLFLCSSKTAISNLKKEGITENLFFTGDLMYEASLSVKIDEKISDKMNLKKNDYLLLTIHRQENTQNEEIVKKILIAIDRLNQKIIFPVHPRTRKIIKKIDVKFKNIQMIEPVSLRDNLSLMFYSKGVITDSGGIQKESYWLKVPCFVLRDSTEWVEPLSLGWNFLVGKRLGELGNLIKTFKKPKIHSDYYGKGDASKKIAESIGVFLKK